MSSVDDRIRALVLRAIEGAGDEIVTHRMVLNVDGWTHSHMRVHYMDWNVDTEEWCWHGIPAVIREEPMHVELVCPGAEVVVSETTQRTKCLYMAVTKDNGRVVYYDDPECDEIYL